MGKVIQMIAINEENSLFIIDFNEGTEELVFRTSMSPKQRQTETVTISEETVSTTQYHFHIAFLSKFITANMD